MLLFFPQGVCSDDVQLPVVSAEKRQREGKPHLKAQTYYLDLCLEFKTARCLEALNEQPWTPVLREEGEIKMLLLIYTSSECSFSVATFCDFVICPGYASLPASNAGKRTEIGRSLTLEKANESLSHRLTKTNRTNI